MTRNIHFSSVGLENPHMAKYFSPSRKPDPSVVTARRSALKPDYGDDSLKNMPDMELMKVAKLGSGTNFEKEAKWRNLL